MLITVLDKGPSEPKPLGAEADDNDKAAHKTARAEREAWHEKNKEPIKIKMAAIDANHAVAADPERYEIVERENMSRKSGDPESRLSNIEARLDALEKADETPTVEPETGPLFGGPTTEQEH
jgi:hypothetical protein